MPIEGMECRDFVFKESAIIDAVDNFKSGIPFLQNDSDGRQFPIGFVDSLKYEDGKLIAEGFTWAADIEIMADSIKDGKIGKIRFKGMSLEKI